MKHSCGKPAKGDDSKDFTDYAQRFLLTNN